MKKIPIFYHIPKCAGTYINNVCFAALREAADGEPCYHIDITKDGHIAYRLLCYGEVTFNNAYNKINNVCYSVDFDHFKLQQLKIFMVRVADYGFYSINQDLRHFLKRGQEFQEFICLRDPYQRALSMFNYTQSENSSHELYHNAFANLTFEDYINSTQIEDSWLIRRLTGLEGIIPITQKNFDKACSSLDKMRVFDISKVDVRLRKIMLECHDIDIKNLNIFAYGTQEETRQARQEYARSGRKNKKNIIFKNKTEKKENIRLHQLKKETREAWQFKSQWDRKIYNNYVH